mmetsp:Transcript_3661/g.9889  ORF Transcript_3661/g.9889 Transcript_3661/m.9889 type:complete len:288 (-) Transcript_3661:2168-3031(-)
MEFRSACSSSCALACSGGGMIWMLFSIARACCAGWPPVKRDRPSRPPSLSRSRSATLTLLPRVWPGAWGMESTSALMKKELRRSSSVSHTQTKLVVNLASTAARQAVMVRPTTRRRRGPPPSAASSQLSRDAFSNRCSSTAEPATRCVLLRGRHSSPANRRCTWAASSDALVTTHWSSALVYAASKSQSWKGSPPSHRLRFAAPFSPSSGSFTALPPCCCSCSRCWWCCCSTCSVCAGFCDTARPLTMRWWWWRASAASSCCNALIAWPLPPGWNLKITPMCSAIFL